MTTKKSYKLAALLLALVLALSACAGKQENKSADPAGSGQTNAQSAKPGAEAETGTRSPEEPGTEPAEDPVRTDPQTPADFGTQAAAVAEQYCDWSDTLEQYMYPTAALTDLDQNGRLELIIASCEGSGLFTYSNFRELDEDLKLQPLSFPKAEQGSQPDICCEYLECFFDEQTGLYSYPVEDIMHNGYQESYSILDVLSKDGSLIDYYYLGSCTRIIDDQGVQNTEFYDFGEELITEAQYYALPDDYLPCTQKYLAHISWISPDDFDQLGVPEALRVSADGFCLTPWEETPYLDGRWVVYGHDDDADGLKVSAEPALQAELYIYGGNTSADLHWYDAEWTQEDLAMPVIRQNGPLFAGCGNDSYYLELDNPTDNMGYYLVVLDPDTLRFVVYDWDNYDENGPATTEAIFTRE